MKYLFLAILIINACATSKITKYHRLIKTEKLVPMKKKPKINKDEFEKLHLYSPVVSIRLPNIMTKTEKPMKKIILSKKNGLVLYFLFNRRKYSVVIINRDNKMEPIQFADLTVTQSNGKYDDLSMSRGVTGVFSVFSRKRSGELHFQLKLKYKDKIHSYKFKASL